MKKPTTYTLSVCCEAHGTTCHTTCIYLIPIAFNIVLILHKLEVCQQTSPFLYASSSSSEGGNSLKTKGNNEQCSER